MNRTDVMPWYREPWPWLLMAGPVAVVIAGIATVWIAVSSSDGLVADDYYKQGLAINQTLQREAVAVENGYRADVVFAGNGKGISLNLQARPGVELPKALQLRIVHPTRAGRDGLVLLRMVSAGRYEGVSPSLSEGRWMLVLQDQQSTWRLDGTMIVPQQGGIAMLPASSK